MTLPVVGLVTEFVGVGVYLDLNYLARQLQENPLINVALLAVEREVDTDLYERLERMPGVLGVTLRSRSISAFNDLMDESILVFTLFSMLLAGLIAFAERGRELASLRVLGYTRLETAYLLLGELFLLTLLALLPGFAWVHC